MITFNTFTPVLPTEVTAPFVPASAGFDDSSSSSRKSSKSSSSSNSRVSVGGLDPNMIKYILDNNLPSDVKEFFTEMEDAITHAYNPVTGQANFAAYKLLLPKLVEMKSNYQQFKDASTKMMNNNAQDELAISPEGYLFVAGDPSIPGQYYTVKSPNEITNKDRILTNGELVRFRTYNTSSAFNNQIIAAIGQGVSADAITQFIQKAIQDLGSTSNKSELHRNIGGEALEGINLLYQFLTGDPSLKESNLSKSQHMEALAALKYIQTMMPRNMNILLQAKAKQRGISAEELLSDYVFSKEDTVYSQKDSVARGSSGGSKDSPDFPDNVEMSNAMLFFSGKGNIEPFAMTNGQHYAYVGWAVKSSTTDKDGKLLQMYDPLTTVFNGEFRGGLDQYNITMGDVEVLDMNRVILDGANIQGVDLPIDEAAANPNNPSEKAIIKPDLQALSKVDAAERQIKDENVAADDYRRINEIYDGKQLPAKYLFNEATGEWVENKREYRRFAVLHGWADEEALDKIYSDNDFLTQVGGRNYRGTSEATLKEHFLKQKGSKVVNDPPDKIYEGMIFIPMNTGKQSILGPIASSNIRLKSGQIVDIQTKQGQVDAKQQYGYVSGGSFSANSGK